MTLTLNRPWSILDICAELFENPTRDLKDIEWTQKRGGQTDKQTDIGAKNNMSTHFMGGDIVQ